MRKKIYIKNWLSFKPYQTQKNTDLYYLRISNKVKDRIYETQPDELHKFIDDEDFSYLSCLITSYFEDIISETQIWNTFIQEHKKLYNKPIPFYEPSNYRENDINEEDIIFLIWYFLNTIQDDKFIVPFLKIFTIIAENIFEIFEEEWEFAPVNEYLKSCYKIDENEDDYYVVRKFMDKVFFESYLFVTDTGYQLHLEETEILEETKEKEEAVMLLNEARDNSLHSYHTHLLSLSAKEWSSKILGQKHQLHNDIASMSKRVSGFFFYKGQNDSYVFLEHIATGMKFELFKESYDYADSLNEIDQILFIGLVNWKGNWWFSGNEFTIDFNADLILDERNSLTSRAQVSFLNDQQETRELIQKQEEVFKQFNNGSSIAFMKKEKINQFCQSFFEYFNEQLQLSKQEFEEADQRMREDGLLSIDDNSSIIDEDGDFEDALVFFNPKSGIEIAIDVNSAFPSPDNPFFDEEKSENHIMTLLMDDGISTELAMYCIDHYKEELTFFTEDFGIILIEDIDFLIRFWKKEEYYFST